MLQSFALQNSSLNFKNTKHENVTDFYLSTWVEGQYLWKTSIWLHKLVIRTYFKHQIKYVKCVTCKIRLSLTKHCLI